MKFCIGLSQSLLCIALIGVWINHPPTDVKGLEGVVLFITYLGTTGTALLVSAFYDEVN